MTLNLHRRFFIFRALSFLVFSLLPLGAATITGQINNAITPALTTVATVSFSLHNCVSNPVFTTSGQIIPLQTDFSITSNGLLSGTLAGNDVITCSGHAGRSFYQMTVTQAGAVVFTKPIYIYGGVFDVVKAGYFDISQLTSGVSFTGSSTGGSGSTSGSGSGSGSSSGSSGVSSFNGRTGVIVPANADYSAGQIAGFASAAAAAAPVQSVAAKTGAVTLSHSDIADWSTATAGFGVGTSAVASFNGRTGVVTPTTNDYAASQITNFTTTAAAAAPIQSIKVNGTTQTPTAGAVSLTVPTNNNQLTNGLNLITAAQAPVQSVATRTGAITLTHSDITDWTSATSSLGTTLNARNRTCMMTLGTESGSALLDTDLGPQHKQCYLPVGGTLKEIMVSADGGQPSVQVGLNHQGVTTNISSAALATAASGGLACANVAGGTGLDAATTCSSTLQNTSAAAGDWLELVSGSAGGVAKRVSIAVTFVVP